MDATGVCRLSWLLSGEIIERKRRGVREDDTVLSAPIVKELAFTT